MRLYILAVESLLQWRVCYKTEDFVSLYTCCKNCNNKINYPDFFWIMLMCFRKIQPISKQTVKYLGGNKGYKH